MACVLVFFFQAEDGIRVLVRSRGLGDVYKRQVVQMCAFCWWQNISPLKTDVVKVKVKNPIFGNGLLLSLKQTCIVIQDWRIIYMDKMGLGMLIVGILLVIGGAYGIWFFLPDVINVVKGAIGVVALLIGIMLAGIGFILVKD